jgi:hypothetical protein
MLGVFAVNIFMMLVLFCMYLPAVFCIVVPLLPGLGKVFQPIQLRKILATEGIVLEKKCFVT